MQRNIVCALAAAAGIDSAVAAEVTVRNDSLESFGTAVIVTGFAAGEKAASWLTSPCDGDLRAVQVLWRSNNGTSGQTIHDSIEIFRTGTFPNPGALAETIGGPVLTDGVLNEYRFLDENNVVPLIVPVTEDETVVVSLTFDTAPPLPGPSVVRDTDGIEPARNGLYANVGGNFTWFDAQALGVTGDWVIRAVIDCQVVAMEADVAVGLASAPKLYTAGQPLAYTVVVGNSGPASAPDTTVVDIFPVAYTAVSWTCNGSGGASCAAKGSGNITQQVDLPAGGEVVFDIAGTVSPGATGVLSNTVTAVVAAGISDPVGGNNTRTLETAPDTDRIFGNGFEP
jgi:uncharacterized repeat protein (TIGR01451 family)